MGILILLIFVAIVFCILRGGFIISPQKPEITHAEFPIKATCKINGKEYASENTIVCDYKGTRIIGETDKYRVWEAYLKNGDQYFIIGSGVKNGKYYEVSIPYGIAEYYMGDYMLRSKEFYVDDLKTNYNRIGIKYFDEDSGETPRAVFSYEDARKHFNLEELNIEYSQPLLDNCSN